MRPRKKQKAEYRVDAPIPASSEPCTAEHISRQPIRGPRPQFVVDPDSLVPPFDEAAVQGLPWEEAVQAVIARYCELNCMKARNTANDAIMGTLRTTLGKSHEEAMVAWRRFL